MSEARPGRTVPAGGALPPPRTYATTEMTAEVCDQGAQVLRWAPAGAGPVLWLSPLARFEPGRPIRGGVPICFPWFGPGRSGDLSPAHGFARTTSWRLVAEQAGDAVVVLVYELTEADATAPAFPHRYHAAYRVALGPEPALDLTVTNTGDRSFEVDEALHAYLAVGDIRRVRLEGLDGVERDASVRVTGCDDDQSLGHTVERDASVRVTGCDDDQSLGHWVRRRRGRARLRPGRGSDRSARSCRSR